MVANATFRQKNFPDIRMKVEPLLGFMLGT